MAHLLDLDLQRAVGNDEPRPRMLDAEREVARPEHVGARDGDHAALERAEHRQVPGRDPPDRKCDAVAAVEARAHKMRPACRVTGDLTERPPIDDALAVDEGQRRLEQVLAVLLDDVPREVEVLGDVPLGVEVLPVCELLFLRLAA